MHLISTADLLKKVRRLEIKTKNIVNEIFSGEYHSSFRGQGIEFSEVREYQPGDNFRDIEWNVSARLGTPYVKLYRETRELNVVFLVDYSASMFYGSSYALKKERVAEIIASLAFSAVANSDRISLILFSDRLERYIPPAKGRNRALEILSEILNHSPEGKQTSLSAACEYAARILKKRAVVFLFSDFYDSGYEKEMGILAKKHDLIAIQVQDESERELPKAGYLRLHDPESGELGVLNTSSPKVRERYRGFVAREQEELESRIKAMGADHILFLSRDSYVQKLRQFFALRHKRKAR